MRIKRKIKKYNKNSLRQFNQLTNCPEYSFYLHYVDKHEYLKEDIFSISIYDRLDNKGMNHLASRITDLANDERFTVYQYIRKPNRGTINYVSYNLVGQTSFAIAEIRAKESNWISSINISATYITNSDVLVETTFYLNKNINSYTRMHGFVQAYQLSCDKYEFYSLYHNLKTINYKTLLDQERKVFCDIFQDILCRYLYSDLGKVYPLPMCISCRIYRYNKLKKRLIQKQPLSDVYYDGNEFLITSRLKERSYYYYYYRGKHFKESRLLSLFSKYTTEMYYRAFYDIEISELENRIRKYLNSNKRKVSIKDIKWLINKLRGIEEQEERLQYELTESKWNIEKWKIYRKKKRCEEKIISNSSTSDDFKRMYKQKLEYLQAISATNDNRTVLIVTISTLVVTAISVIISLLK